MSNTVELKLKKIIADQFGIEVNTLNNQDQLKKFNIDSLDIIEIVMAIEELFNIEIEDNEYETAQTVDDIIKLVESKLV